MFGTRPNAAIVISSISPIPYAAATVATAAAFTSVAAFTAAVATLFGSFWGVCSGDAGRAVEAAVWGRVGSCGAVRVVRRVGGLRGVGPLVVDRPGGS